MDEQAKYGQAAIEAAGFKSWWYSEDTSEADAARRAAGWLPVIDVGTASRVQAYVRGSECIVIWQFGRHREEKSAALIPSDGTALLDLLGRILPLLRDVEAIQAATSEDEETFAMFGAEPEEIRARARMVAAGYDLEAMGRMAEAHERRRGVQRARQVAVTMRQDGDPRERFIQARPRYESLDATDWALAWDETD